VGLINRISGRSPDKSARAKLSKADLVRSNKVKKRQVTTD
jgi:hypothetical protein